MARSRRGEATSAFLCNGEQTFGLKSLNGAPCGCACRLRARSRRVCVTVMQLHESADRKHENKTRPTETGRPSESGATPRYLEVKDARECRDISCGPASRPPGKNLERTCGTFGAQTPLFSACITLHPVYTTHVHPGHPATSFSFLFQLSQLAEMLEVKSTLKEAHG